LASNVTITIVEIRAIVRHIKIGKSPYRATTLDDSETRWSRLHRHSLRSSRRIAPVSFMGEECGQFFKQFGLTGAVAVSVCSFDA